MALTVYAISALRVSLAFSVTVWKVTMDPPVTILVIPVPLKAVMDMEIVMLSQM